MISIPRKMRTEVGNWVYRNARAIDLSRWLYHFENGCPEEVINALSKYQNRDGGFGHGLEADSWNPNSTPIQTWQATEILYEIRFFDPENDVIEGILKYLDSSADFNGRVWYSTVLSNNDYPHAPWWHANSGNTDHSGYNPTAALAGFGLFMADPKSEIYDKCSVIAREAFNQYIQSGPENDMHTVRCYVRLLEYCELSENYDTIDLRKLREKLAADIGSLLNTDTGSWSNGSYICKPSQFFNSPRSVFYDQNKEIAEFECDFILSSQNTDGVWDIPWKWSGYSREWTISENWWKGDMAVRNMLYLKNFDRL